MVRPRSTGREHLYNQTDPLPEVEPSRETRGQAEARGRMYGQEEVERRGETGDEAADRVRRAVEYAVWEWEGKPISRDPVSQKQRQDWKQGKRSKGASSDD